MTILLQPHEPPAVEVERETAESSFFLTCDHASKRIPERLGSLGISSAERARHIAWDIGAAGVARGLSARLQAPLVLQNYSRLVIDCNRHLWREDLIPTLSEATEIPGNRRLDERARQARINEIHAPYHTAIARLLAARHARGQAPIYVSVHSFTPVYLGQPRPQHIGLLSNRDRRVADLLLAGLRADPAGLCVGDNEPYRLTAEGDYGVPVHAERRGLPYVLLEIRQDLIATATGQQEWAARLAVLLLEAAATLRAVP